MPFVDIIAKDDYVSLWYWTNACNNNVGMFDFSRPTLVLLHPISLDSAWMQPQLEDPRLFNHYNMIMFDTRVTGKSRCRYSGKHDLWVTAADLAQAFYHLRLPPSHLFAPDLFTHSCLRFAALFPELCLSLTLCNVPPPTETKAVFDSLEELNQMWGFAEDLESYEYVCKELLNYSGGTFAHPDLQDEIVAYWEHYYPPFRRAYCMASMNLILNRTPMSQKELASITCPVLIIQAEKSIAHPFSFAEQLQRDLCNSDCKLLKTHGSTAGLISIVHASVINKAWSSFLSTLPRVNFSADEKGLPPVNAWPYTMSLKDFMMPSLRRLADFKDDPSILERDPCSPLSFSCNTPEIIKNQEDTLAKYVDGQQLAFSPLGPDGRPIRKYSERSDHWLEAGKDGYSRSEISKKMKEGDKKKRPKWGPRGDPDRDKTRYSSPDSGSGTPGPPTPPLEETVTSEDQQVARMRRGNAPTVVVDKQVLKGAAAKLTSTHSSQSPGQTIIRSFMRS